MVALSSLRVGQRTSAQRPATSRLGERLERLLLLVRLAEQCARAVEDDGAVVDRVVERRAGEHEPVDQRDGQAQRRCRRRAPAASGSRPQPWITTSSPTRACSVGITAGRPSWTKPTWLISASSRIASIVGRSCAPRLGRRRSLVRAVVTRLRCLRRFQSSVPVQLLNCVGTVSGVGLVGQRDRRERRGGRSRPAALAAGRARCRRCGRSPRALDVSPTTVAAALADLRRRGVVVSRPRSGTRVADRPPLRRQVAAGARRRARPRHGQPRPGAAPRRSRALAAPQRLYGEPTRSLPELAAVAARGVRRRRRRRHARRRGQRRAGRDRARARGAPRAGRRRRRRGPGLAGRARPGADARAAARRRSRSTSAGCCPRRSPRVCRRPRGRRHPARAQPVRRRLRRRPRPRRSRPRCPTTCW